MMPLFEAARAVAFDARAAGEDYEPLVRAAIAALEERFGERLSEADVALVLASPFNGGQTAGLRDVAYELALAKQAEKERTEGKDS